MQGALRQAAESLDLADARRRTTEHAHQQGQGCPLLDRVGPGLQPVAQSRQAKDEIPPAGEQVQLPRIAAFIEAGEPIEFVLPAFPAKSPNPGKVLDSRPDMAERLSLSFLNHLCQRIQLFYAPGAKITVCSDGRVFGDLVRIGDAHISAYQDALRLMIEEIGATHIGVFNLEDVRAFEAQRDNHEQLRQLLIDGYAEPLESIRETLLASEEGLLLYRAITRFLYEDGLTPDYQGSKTALQRDAKERAYGVIQRSWAWGALLADQFPHAIRLSIHPQPADSLKFGIHMMPTRDDWLTPWHGVALNVAWPRASLAPPDAPWFQVWAVVVVFSALAAFGLLYMVIAKPHRRIATSLSFAAPPAD